ncbi:MULTISPECIES: ImmA/IrrE family metallo-endopeptidase [Chromohalobacter]|uniref:ImmA/IrrE family metallo-endopeptidase n=1 Tax=Chromohalobacter TaxID=42054 RepID=UPI001FFCF20D|nr:MULTISPECIES: ImmA/IrrE family metallo-endopeptidase [Chromohalobacter]MCK2045617.1 ImmA/IrrE family metallo-endopeptidase [Chromohalobacter moromii]MCT8468310.1 ImmA/IrrE family metallo-endopeptidase [Chromohalobacter canadensis]MCT8471365.1 ImmA/IrrE family metallo-endopeptidase [Chromohalobacter canadensis]MCT8498818.1 ImmA/IrrE family metallo-endopeptidase [Chromohalobacter canadensis]
MALKKRKKVPKVQIQGKTTPSEVLKIAEEKGVETKPLDVHSLAKALSLRVEYKVLQDDVSGMLKSIGDSWVVIVNSLHHKNRQRFTIAHEIAHFLLHRNCAEEFVDKAFFRSDDGVGGLEAQANQFAAKLLMPREEFVNYVKQKSDSLKDVAEEFGVSTAAVKVRADSIRQGEG